MIALLSSLLLSGGAIVWARLGLSSFDLGRAPTPAPPPTMHTSEPTPPSTPDPLAASPQGCTQGEPPVVVASDTLPITSTARSSGARGEVALTFDDGPSPLYTPQILAALQAAGAHATFFVLGSHAQRYPEQVRAEWQAGDAIGNHTFSHEYVPGLRSEQLQATLAATTAAIRAATGDACVWLFRPPFGALGVGTTVLTEVRQEGYTVVTWDVQAWDWRRPGANVIAQRVITQLHAGAIILLHDSGPDTQNQDRSQTVAALPQILAAMKQQGLRAVTLPQLLHDAGVSHPAARFPRNRSPASHPIPAPSALHSRSICAPSPLHLRPNPTRSLALRSSRAARGGRRERVGENPGFPLSVSPATSPLLFSCALLMQHAHPVSL